MIYHIKHNSEIREVEDLAKFQDKTGYYAQKQALLYKFDLRKKGTFKINCIGEKTQNKKFRINDEYIIQFKDISLIHQGVIILNDKEVFLDHFINHLMYNPIEKLGIMREASKKYLSIELTGDGCCLVPNTQITKIIQEPAFLFASMREDAYSHFVWETLTLKYYLDQLTQKNIKIILIGEENNYPKYKLDLLDKIGIQKEQIIYKPFEDNFFFKKLLVGANLAVNNRIISTNGAQILRQLRVKSLSEQNKIKIAYFDRNDERQGIRSIVNENKILEAFQELKYNVEIITPGKLNIEEKQKLFSQYDIIIGQYGGGLQHQFLFKDNVIVITLQSTSFFRDILHFTQSIYKQKVISIVGKAKNKKNNSDFTIDVDLLMKTIKEQIGILEERKNV